MIEIRPELPGDIEAIYKLNELAFAQPAEATLVDALRVAGAVTLSLVALEQDKIVGHILFSPVTIKSGKTDFLAIGLGPMSVAPQRQKQGIGSRLVRKAIEVLHLKAHKAVVVLGHPDFYPRFGFVKASTHKIKWEIEVPDEAFMVLELVPGSLPANGGIVHYHPQFMAV